MADLQPRYTVSAALTGAQGGALSFAATPAASVVAQLAAFFKGDKGDPGDKGDKGDPGPSGAGFDYTQASPADTWTIAHNLGYRPSVSTFTPGGLEMMGSAQHLSNDVLQITFTQAVAGTARLN